MKTIDSYLEEHPHSGTREIENGYHWCDVEDMMRDYAHQLLDHLLQNAAEYIYIIEDDNMPDEAVFNYQKIEELRKSI